jgi:hypothetical protein
MLASASIFNSLAGIAVDVISLFIALLSSRGISTPSLQARGEQRRFFYFNNDRDIPDFDMLLLDAPVSCDVQPIPLIASVAERLRTAIVHDHGHENQKHG